MKYHLVVLPNNMCRFFVAISFFCLTSCSGQPTKRATQIVAKPSTTAAYTWTQLTRSAAFPKAYNFQVFSIRDTLWVMHHAGVWFSPDGRDWSKATLPNILGDNAFLDYVWFKNALYSLGTFHGNVERFQQTSAVYKTTNMKTWDTVAIKTNLPKRFFCHPFVFKDKLWIIGGNDGTTTYSDIWSSTDGVAWRKERDNLPFGKREHSQFVLFNGKIFLLNNDVWASSDGLQWTRVADRIAGKDIFGYAPVVYNNRIWLMGCNRDGKFQSQVLVSKDGKSWLTQPAPWSPRGAATACVHKGNVYLTGGKYGGLTRDGQMTRFVYSNDVWKMEEN